MKPRDSRVFAFFLGDYSVVLGAANRVILYSDRTSRYHLHLIIYKPFYQHFGRTYGQAKDYCGRIDNV